MRNAADGTAPRPRAPPPRPFPDRTRILDREKSVESESERVHEREREASEQRCDASATTRRHIKTPGKWRKRQWAGRFSVGAGERGGRRREKGGESSGLKAPSIVSAGLYMGFSAPSPLSCLPLLAFPAFCLLHGPDELFFYMLCLAPCEIPEKTARQR